MDFNEINESWKKINEEKFSSTTIKKEEIMEAIKKESSLTIAELKKRLNYKLYWIYLFVVLAIVGIIWNIGNPPMLGLCAVFLVLYSYGGFGLYNEIKRMDDQIDSSKDTLSEMKKHREIVHRTLQKERRWGFVAIPIIIFAVQSFYKIKEGIPFSDFMTDPVFLGITIIMIIVFVYLTDWWAKKMNNKGYGSYIENLEENIDKMEEIK